jgi:hypothetical protein
MAVQAESDRQPMHDYVVVRGGAARNATVHIYTSQILLVELSVQLGTGYTWAVARYNMSIVEGKRLSDDETRLLRESGVLKNERGPNMAGSAEFRVFQFRPLSPGKAEVEFHSIRPREPERVDKTFLLSINISH